MISSRAYSPVQPAMHRKVEREGMAENLQQSGGARRDGGGNEDEYGDEYEDGGIGWGSWYTFGRNGSPEASPRGAQVRWRVAQRRGRVPPRRDDHPRAPRPARGRGV